MQSPSIPPASDFRFRCSRRTRWCDEDNQHVVNNAVYMTLLEEARFQYFSELGLLAQNQFPFVLAQTNICFLSPGVGGTELTLSVRTTALGRTSFTQVYRIEQVTDGLILCEAEARLVCWSNARAEKAAMTEAFREAIAAFEALGVERTS